MSYRLTEEEKSGMIDEPRRLTDELYRYLSEHKLDLITAEHYEALRVESEKVQPGINWEEPF
jgi:DNA-binding transcriptional ArsR family regulator